MRVSTVGKLVAVIGVVVVLISLAEAATPVRRFAALPGHAGKPASLLVTVRDALSNRPVPNAWVALAVTGAPCVVRRIAETACVESLRVETDKKGRARFTDVPPGCVTIMAVAAGRHLVAMRRSLRPEERGKTLVVLHVPVGR